MNISTFFNLNIQEIEDKLKTYKSLDLVKIFDLTGFTDFRSNIIKKSNLYGICSWKQVSEEAIKFRVLRNHSLYLFIDPRSFDINAVRFDYDHLIIPSSNNKLSDFLIYDNENKRFH